MASWHYPQRSQQEELLDAEDLPRAALHQNLRELALVNRFLGGYRISELALQAIQQHFNYHTLIDIGCGGGDTLHRLVSKLPAGVAAEGWDLKADCIDFCQKHYPHPQIRWVQGDFREAVRHKAPGTLFHAALFFHHFSSPDIIAFIHQITAAGHALIINDLERHRFARHSIKVITQLWPGASYLVRNDAPLSVQRAFVRADWEAMLAQLPGIAYDIRYRWAFRHQICIWPIQGGGER